MAKSINLKHFFRTILLTAFSVLVTYAIATAGLGRIAASAQADEKRDVADVHSTAAGKSVASEVSVEQMPEELAKGLNRLPRAELTRPGAADGLSYQGEIEPNNTSAGASPIVSPAVVRANLFPNGDTDFYSFSANAGDRVYAATMTSGSAGSSSDSRLELVAADGTTTIEFDDDNGTFASLSSTIAGAAIPTSGTYYLRVSDFTAGTTSQRPYELYLRVQNTAPVPETEANDTPATANPLPAGGHVSGTRNPAAAAEQDWYSFNMNAGDTVMLSLDLNPERDAAVWDGRLGFGLVGDAGDQIIVADDAGTGDVSPVPANPSEAMFVTVKAAGTYYAMVDSASAGVGDPSATYGLSVTVFPAANQGVNCTTYTSTNVPQAIGPGAGLSSSTITIPGNPRIADVDVSIVLNHSVMNQVDAHLRSPAGNNNGLFTDIGAPTAGGQTQMDITLDDEAGIPPLFTALKGLQFKPENNSTAGTASTSGSYRLSSFDGENAGGTWTLDLYDDVDDAQGGTLTSWSMRVCEQPAEAACPAGFTPTTVFSTDFESGAAGFTHSGTNDEWELGLPATAATNTNNPVADFTTCASGVSCWKTDLDNTYNASSNQNLLSPNINLAGLAGPVTVSWSMRHQVETANFDHFFIDAQQVGGATPVRLYEWLDPTPISASAGTGNPQQNIGASYGWGRHTRRIDSLAGLNTELRFHLDSDTTVQFGGVAVDDVVVTACQAATADLAITKTDGVATATAGGSVTYTITASNAGPGAATATVADTFPAALTATWTCVGAGGGTCTAAGSGNISDSVNLPAGGSVTYTATAAVSPSAAGTLSNTATVTSALTDPDPANNSATDTDTVVASADLSIAKSDGVATFVPGGTLTYTIIAANNGPSDGNAVTVTDTFPAALTGVTWTCVGAAGGTCPAAGSGNISAPVNLPAGGSVTFTATGTVAPGTTGNVSNTATVTGSVPDPDPGNNSFTDTDVAPPAIGCSTETTATYSQTTPVAIPSGPAVVTSTLNVSGAGPYLLDANALTNIVHSFAADLDVTITSPAGTVVTLTTDNGAGNDNVFNGTVWDDDANIGGQVPYVTNAGLVTDHPYANLVTATPLAPEEPLAAFIGENPNGTWTITISDDVAGDSGSIDSWSLQLTTLPAAPVVTAQPTFTQNTPVGIPTGPGVVTSTLVVSGLPARMSDVNLTTFLPHSFPADLDVTLTSPSGTVVTLTTDNGAGNDNIFNGTVWDDDANPAGQVPYATNDGLVTDHAYANLTTATPLAPEEPLGAFFGENPNGTWTITISDDLAGDGGSLDSWSLDISTIQCSFPTTTTVTSSANPSVYGQPVTFTATVASVPPGQTPTGTVQFVIDGSNAGAPVAVDGSGTAQYTTSSLDVGNHTVSANYVSSSPAFQNSSGTLTGNPQVVTAAATTTTVTSSANPSVFGQPVTFTATVAAVPPGQTPTGTVQFVIDGSNAGAPVAVDGSGTAQFTTSALDAGNHTVSANYVSSSPAFQNSSGTLTGNPQVVAAAATTTTVTSSTNPSVFGQPVTFTATVAAVAPGAGTPSGTVTFYNLGNAISGPVTLVGGTAQFTTSSLPVGSYTINATYAPGNANYLASNGFMAGNPQVVNKANTTTNLASSANPSTFGQAVTFTATVASSAPGAGTPTGAVSFSDGATPIAGCQNVPLSGAGTALCTPATLSVGTHAISAAYSGDLSFNASQNTLSQVVNKASTGIVITSDNPDPSAVGQAIVVNYSLNPSTAAATPTGSVVVTISGGPETCTGTISVPAGTGSCVLTLTAPGTRTITATYAGDANFTGGADTESHIVSQSATTTTITNAAALANSPTVVGQSYAVNVTVAPVAPGAGSPTGTVTVGDGTTTCTITLTAASNGSGSCSLTAATPGIKTITASYSGDANFTASAAATVQKPVVISIAGNVKQFVSPAGPNTNLAGVTVTLAVNGTPAATATTDASGNYSFALLTAGNNLVITPSGLGKTYEPASRSYFNVTGNITGADFVAYDANGANSLPRELKVLNTVGTPGQAVTIPLTLNSQGNETSVSFTLAFDPARLGVPTAAVCGSGFVGCSVTTFNTLTPGRVGVTVSRGAALAAGVQEVVRVTFPTFAATAGSVQISYADAPTVRATLNAAGDPLPTLYTGGFISFTPDLEGDVAGANGAFPGGDGVLANDVTLIRQMALGLIQPTAAQFRYADTAPRSTLGDGCPINSTDVTQAARYNLGLDAPAGVGGPSAPIPGGCQPGNTRGERDSLSRVLSVTNTEAAPGEPVTVSLQLDALGDEAAMSFGVDFDAKVLRFVRAGLGADAPTGAHVSLNRTKAQDGRLGVLIDGPNPFAAGPRQLVTLTFEVSADASKGSYPIAFSPDVTGQSTSGPDGELLDTRYAEGAVTIGKRRR